MIEKYSTKILKRFLSEEELNSLNKKYDESKKITGKWYPTEEDWRMFRRNTKLTIQEWKGYWDIKEETVIRRLGKMYLQDN